jgi:hypothetical protein
MTLAEMDDVFLGRGEALAKRGIRKFDSQILKLGRGEAS